MLINMVHIYIFGIPNHHRLMPCTWFLGVKRLPAEKVLKNPVRAVHTYLIIHRGDGGECRVEELVPPEDGVQPVDEGDGNLGEVSCMTFRKNLGFL